MFQAGEDVPALITENHKEHIMTHLELLNSPEAKKNPQLVAMVTQHVMEHLDLWRNADPAILMLTGQDPAPPLPMTQVPNPNQMPTQEPMPIQGPEVAQQPNMPSVPQGTDPNSQVAYEQFQANVAQ
jgi:hypothetical protein